MVVMRIKMCHLLRLLSSNRRLSSVYLLKNNVRTEHKFTLFLLLISVVSMVQVTQIDSCLQKSKLFGIRYLARYKKITGQIPDSPITLLSGRIQYRVHPYLSVLDNKHS